MNDKPKDFKRHLDLFFPTPIYSSDLADATNLNENLIKNIEEWEKKDRGLKNTNQGGWHSTTNMYLKKEYEPLVKELNKFQKQICIEESYIHPTILVDMWANINYPGCSNRSHNHPNAQWSGVYYVKTPKDCGNLILEDPRPGYAMTVPQQISAHKLPYRLLRNVAYIPAAGRLMMFPSFLNHYVDINKSKENRISISFNFIQMVSYTVIKEIADRVGKIEK
jgi:uncharacterized protein (TIGR02466 family)